MITSLVTALALSRATASMTTSVQIREYWFALNVTAPFWQSIGDQAMAEIAIAEALFNLNERLRRDLNIELVIGPPGSSARLQLLPADDFWDAPPNWDTLLSRNQAECDGRYGVVGYDLGFILTKSASHSEAQLGTFRVIGSRARGGAATTNPIAFLQDPRSMDHEIGHMLGAKHTFDSWHGDCGDPVQRASAYCNAVEIGSGVTRMCYPNVTPRTSIS